MQPDTTQTTSKELTDEMWRKAEEAVAGRQPRFGYRPMADREQTTPKAHPPPPAPRRPANAAPTAAA